MWKPRKKIRKCGNTRKVRARTIRIIERSSVAALEDALKFYFGKSKL